MLLPYYVAAMNIEHAYYELTGSTSRSAASVSWTRSRWRRQADRVLLLRPGEHRAREAAEEQPRSRRHRQPAVQRLAVNENDNNKNRKYEVVDGRSRQTYAEGLRRRHSSTRLSDPYVKAYTVGDRPCRRGRNRRVSYRTTASSRRLAFDGMRKNLEQRFQRSVCARPRRQRPQEPEAVGDDAQRIRHTGRREHQHLS